MRRATRLLAAGPWLAYPVVSHAAIAGNDPRWAAVGIALIAWIVLSFRRNLVAAASGTVVLFGLALAIEAITPSVVVYVPPMAINIALCAVFALSLREGSEPIISRFARMEYSGALPPELEHYTRILTVMWSAFFALMASTSFVLAVWGTAMAWSLFTNVVSYVLVFIFLIGEYTYRRIRYRRYPHASPAEFMRRLHTYRILSRPADEPKG